MNLTIPNTPLNTPLGQCLIELIHAVQLNGINTFMLVGGFALILRLEHRRQYGIPTLLSPLPASRATNDLDVMLSLKILADIKHITQINSVLDELSYTVKESAKYYQFTKTLPNDVVVTIDLLAPMPLYEHAHLYKIKDRRISRKGGYGNVSFHAHKTPEAFAVYDSPFTLTLGAHTAHSLLIPHAYAFLHMKLFAFRDRQQNYEKSQEKWQQNLARKHAGDIFTIIASMTEEENQSLCNFTQQYLTHPIAREAQGIIREHFSSSNARGILYMQEEKHISNHDSDVILDVIQNDILTQP